MPESRAAYVAGLENELAFLKAQPAPKADRIADVEKQLDHFASHPEKRVRETAEKPAPAEQGIQLEYDADAKRSTAKKAAAPAKKAAAPARRAARKAAAKKPAPKK